MRVARQLRLLGLCLLITIAPSVDASWTPCGPEEALHVTFLSVDPHEPRTLYATGSTGPAASDGAAWTTTDGCRTWRRLDPGGAADDPLPGQVEAHPGAPRTVYLTSRAEFLRSRDAGASWERVGAIGDPSQDLDSFAIAFGPSSFYAALGTLRSAPAGGVFISTDGGSTWKPTSLSGRTVFDLVLSGSGNEVYAATSFGISRSADGGASWNEIGPQGVEARYMTLTADPVEPRTLYAGTAGEGVFTSKDGGATWTPPRRRMAYPTVYALAVDPANTQDIWAGTSGGGVFRSRDGGETWSEANDGLDARYVQTLVIAPTSPSQVYVGTIRRGVFKWTGD